jgi:hypothetical protein
VKYDDKELDKIRKFLERGGDPEEAEQGHLSVQELTAFWEGELSSEEAKRIEDHLSSCPECSALLREIDGFFQPPAVTAGAVGDAGAAADWRELHSRLDRRGWFRPVALGPRRELQAGPSWRSGRSRPVNWRHWAAGLAAVLTLVVVGIYFVHRPDQVVTESAVTTLDPSDAFRSELGVQAVPLSHDLVLRTESDRSYGEYQAEFRDLSTGRVTRIPGLREDYPSEVLIEGPQRLEPGEYEIRLLGIRQGGEEFVRAYRVRLLGR